MPDPYKTAISFYRGRHRLGLPFNVFLNATCLYETTQNFSYAPRLCATAAGGERRLRIENFADLPRARLRQLPFESLQKSPRGREIPWMDFQPRINERSNQPCPYRALMIGGVASAKIAIISRFEVPVSRGKRSQPYRRQQLLFHYLQHRVPARFVENRMVQRDRKDLIRA